MRLKDEQTGPRALLLSTFLIATCGLVYELVAGAISSYLLGDTITWFSIIIGTYLSAMGVGSYLSRYVERDLVARFVEIELAVALLGGFEGPILFSGFALTPAFRAVLLGVVALVGIGAGLEIPLLIRILERQSSLKELIARLLFLDYIGALAASLLFPLFFLPQVGLMRTTLVLGLVNAGVALWTTFLFDAGAYTLARLRALSVAVILLLGAGIASAGWWEARLESALFADPVALSIQSSYQRIIVTHAGGDWRLYLDGALQFSSVDEYRYHEALVHLPMSAHPHPARVLVLGGGDGLAVRELLRYPGVERVVLVDLDPEMTHLFQTNPQLVALNGGALNDPRVTVINGDAFQWVRRATDTFDVAIIDFPDPNNYALGKLFTAQFFRMLQARLTTDAVISVQSTSPIYSPRAFSCIANTMEYAGFSVFPYHALVPSFGDWGFVLGTRGAAPAWQPLLPGLRFLTPALRESLFVFPPDIAPVHTPVNRLDNQALVTLYEEDWRILKKL